MRVDDKLHHICRPFEPRAAYDTSASRKACPYILPTASSTHSESHQADTGAVSMLFDLFLAAFAAFVFFAAGFAAFAALMP